MARVVCALYISHQWTVANLPSLSHLPFLGYFMEVPTWINYPQVDCYGKTLYSISTVGNQWSMAKKKSFILYSITCKIELGHYIDLFKNTTVSWKRSTSKILKSHIEHYYPKEEYQKWKYEDSKSIFFKFWRKNLNVKIKENLIKLPLDSQTPTHLILTFFKKWISNIEWKSLKKFDSIHNNLLLEKHFHL